MGKMVALLLVLICLEACQCLNLLQLQHEWSGWKKQHSKSYYTGDEESSRWEVWRENYHKIMEHNKANHSFTLGLNQFADMVSIILFGFFISS